MRVFSQEPFCAEAWVHPILHPPPDSILGALAEAVVIVRVTVLKLVPWRTRLLWRPSWSHCTPLRESLEAASAPGGEHVGERHRVSMGLVGGAPLVVLGREPHPDAGPCSS